MSEFQLSTPVAFLIFNRPDTTKRVFAEIRKAKPPKLLVVADGPRPDHPGEAEKCAETRAIVEQVDWNCEVLTNYADENLGCKRRVSSGLDWVFQNVEEAIILEDDCLPHISFFRYCQELLNYYRTDDRIMHINGNNYGVDQSSIHRYSYSFTRFPQVWGWATWRRAWLSFDPDLKKWPTFRDNGWLNNIGLRDYYCERLKQRWNLVYEGGIDTWDFQWHFAVISQGGLAISPKVNLVTNIGFGESATHTTGGSYKADIPIHEIDFPLQHPPFVLSSNIVDAIYASNMMGQSQPIRALAKRINDKVKRIAHRLGGQ